MVKKLNWEKILDNEDGVVYVNKDRRSTQVQIFKAGPPGKEVWFVDLDSTRSDSLFGRTLRRMKTKSKALKFARAWMRRNPNG